MEEEKHHLSDDLKLRAVFHYIEFQNYSETSRIFICSRRSLGRWVERYLETGTVSKIERQSISYKIKKEHVKFIINIVKDNPSIHVDKLRELLLKKFKDLTISRQHLGSILRDNNITRKRATFEHFPKTYRGVERNEKEELKVFFKEIKKYKSRKSEMILFV